MYDDRLEADQLEKCDILDHLLFKLFVNHCRSAVLYNDNLSVKSLYIRKCLYEHLCLFHYLFHVLICHCTAPYLLNLVIFSSLSVKS